MSTGFLSDGLVASRPCQFVCLLGGKIRPAFDCKT